LTSKRACYHCRKTIRTNSRSAIYLGFLVATKGEPYEAWVCNKKCLNQYNEEGDE